MSVWTKAIEGNEFLFILLNSHERTMPLASVDKQFREC